MQGEVVNFTHSLTHSLFHSFTHSAALPFCRSSVVEGAKDCDINKMQSLPSGTCADGK